jgi:hypothetical protein
MTLVMVRKVSPVLAFLIAFLAVAPLAYAKRAACRVRRPPAVEIKHVPASCVDVLKADVQVRGYPALKSVEVTLDGRVVRRSQGRVRIVCDRLAEGRHVLRVTAVNSNDTRTKAVAFYRD